MDKDTESVKFQFTQPVERHQFRMVSPNINLTERNVDTIAKQLLEIIVSSNLMFCDCQVYIQKFELLCFLGEQM